MAKFTLEQIEVMSRHASERAKLVAEQQNARIEVEERQRAELAAVGIEQAPPPIQPPKGQ